MAGFSFAAPAAQQHSSGGGGGITGFLSHLVSDAGSMARGLPMGIVNTVEHPIGTAENVAKGVWQDWSPLFHAEADLFRGNLGQASKDASKWGHNFYDHPLAPMLDILTVFSGGAALGAKLGAGLSDGSALARLGSMPKTLTLEDPQAAQKLAAGERVGMTRTKLLPSNPIYNAGYRRAMAFADAHPAIPNWFSSSKVYSRLDRADWAGSGLAYRASMASAMKTGETLVKAGHDTMPKIEEQLNQRSFMNLVQNSPAIPVQDILTKYGGHLPEGFKPVRVDLKAGEPNFQVWDKPATNVEELAGHLQKLGEVFTRPANEWQKAIYKDPQTGEAMVKIAHSRAMEATFTDGARSAHFLAKLYRYPTAIWKYSMVGASPRTVLDNGVGNWLMYALRQGGAHAIHGFVDAVRYTRGEAKALQMVKETGQLPNSFLSPKYFRHFQGELGNTFGSAVGGGTGLGAHVGEDTTGSGLSKLYKYSVYPLVHKYADVPVRAASISAYLRGDSTVQGLMKSGQSFADAADTALKHNPQLRDRAIAHARTVAGNYQTLSKSEQIMRDFIPFYLWDKHIVMHASNMLRDRPGVVAVGGKLGQQGTAKTRQMLGDIPDWMIGAIPLSLTVPGEGGRKTLLSTTGLNPYSSVADLTSLAQALTIGHTPDTPGDTILSTVNPVIKSLVDQTMGKTPTGAPVNTHGGVLPSMLADVFNSMRPVELGRTALGMGPPSTSKSGTPRLYKTDINTILSSMFGIPIQEANMSHAIALQKQTENGGKKPKKGRGFSFAP